MAAHLVESIPTYGSRKFYFTFCSIGEYRTRCSYKSNYHKFTYPIPYEESVVDQYYETRQDLYSACSADLVAKTNSPKARCQGSGSWKDDQGRALGFTTQVTGYILYRHPQTTPSWIVYPCSSIYAWQGSITWCQQTNFRSYFEGCPAGTEADPANFNKCEPVADDPFKDNGSPCGNDQAASAGSRSGGKGSAGNMVGNPCHAGTGNKYEAETDFDGVPGLTRSYNSKGQRDVGFGMGWTSNLHKSLGVLGNSLLVHDADGRSEKWTRDSGTWVGNVDTRLNIVEVAGGFKLTRPNGDHENYDGAGKLLLEVDTNGNSTRYTYDVGGRLVLVEGPFGHAISVGYDGNERIVRVSDTAGTEYRYAYSGENLASVRVLMEGNPTRVYLYEDSRFPHHLTGLVDENGDRYATWAYDAGGKAVLTTHSLTTNGTGQRRFDLRYDGDETLVTDAEGNASTWTFDENHAVKRLRSRLSLVDGKGLSQDFDERNNLTERMDEEGRRTTFAYNPTNQRTQMVEAAGLSEQRTTRYEYVSTDTDLLTRIVEPSVYHGQQSETLVNYGSGLNPESVILGGFDPLGQPVTRTHSYAYNAAGLLTSYDGPRTEVQDVAVLEYYECDTGSECGRPARFRNAAGHETIFESYDQAGRLSRSTDSNGVIATYEYDARGRLLMMVLTAPNGESRTTTFRYDLAGQVLTVTTPDNITLAYAYDAAHDLRSIEDNLGNRVEYTYDARGNRRTSEVIDPDSALVRQVELAYDVRGYLESINAAGSLTQWLPDATGNVLEKTDSNYNPSTRFEFDGLNRQRERVDAAGNYTSLAYDVADQLVRVTAPNGAETRYSVDDLGNRLIQESPDRGLITNTFDEAGNLTSSTDARGIVVHYRYDELNRLLESIYQDETENSRYEYDSCGFGVGRLCRTHGPDGVTSLGYDAWGNIARVIVEEDGQVYTTSYQYDAGDRVTRIVDPAGLQFDYARDGVGRVTDVSYSYRGETKALLSGREYRADGLPARQNLGNNLEEVREYDLQGRLTAQELRWASVAVEGLNEFSGDAQASLDNRIYSYDANGNLLDIDFSPDSELSKGKKGSASRDSSWTYDVLDRVVTDDAIESYEYDYDANGNLIYRHKLDKKQGTVYSYGAMSNRLALVGNDEVITDASGNTLSDRGGERTFTYNQRGRMESISDRGILQASYEYNALNQRTAKQLYEYHESQGVAVEADRYNFHYGLDGMMIGEHLDGIPKRSYVRVDGRPIAQVEYRGNGDISRVTYITLDHLSTPRVGTSEDGQIVWRWDSDAYGSAKPDKHPHGAKGSVDIRLRFPGQYHDTESGLFYNWNRYYDPETGRYVTSDPIGLGGGPNTYVYANNNPMGFIDLYGLESRQACVDRATEKTQSCRAIIDKNDQWCRLACQPLRFGRRFKITSLYDYFVGKCEKYADRAHEICTADFFRSIDQCE